MPYSFKICQLNGPGTSETTEFLVSWFIGFVNRFLLYHHLVLEWNIKTALINKIMESCNTEEVCSMKITFPVNVLWVSWPGILCFMLKVYILHLAYQILEARN